MGSFAVQMCMCAFFTAQSFLLFSFASVALVHTNIATFYSACGSELRYMVLLDTVFGAAFLLVGLLSALGSIMWAGSVSINLKHGVVLIGCSLGLCAYLSCFSLLLRDRALELPQCVVVMKQIDDWFDPGSTERGSSLLPSVALVYGVLYGGAAAVLLGMLVCVCCQLCFSRGVEEG